MHDEPKIVIIRLSSIGDIILTTPLVRALRRKFPDGVIDFVVKERYIDLVRTNSHLSNVIAFDHTAGYNELRKLKKLIRKERYDLLIDLHKNFRSVYLRSGSGAARVVKYRKDYIKRALLVWFGINRFDTVVPIYQRYFRAAASLEITPDDEGTELHVPEETSAHVRSILVKSGLQTDQQLVVLCPGAGFATKRWYPEGFAAVGDHFSRNRNTMIGILGSYEDKNVCEAVQRHMMARSVSFAGTFSLIETAALMKQSSIVITNDSGLMHIAQTQRKPVVALFGSTTRELGYYPFAEKSFVIEKNLDCRPCTHNGRKTCPKKHFKCMLDSTPDEVIEAAEQLFVSEMHIPTREDYGENLVSSL